MLHFDEIAIGLKFQSSSRTILDADIVNFAGLSGDFNRLHVDDVFAATTPFKRRIAHGMLVASIVTGLKSKMDDMAVLAFLETSRKFRKPVFPGDTVTANFEVTEMRPSKSQPGTGVIVFSVRVVNQRGETVQEGQDIIMFERKAP